VLIGESTMQFGIPETANKGMGFATATLHPAN
jgi:hypothetical protein